MRPILGKRDKTPALKALVERELECESNWNLKKQWQEFVHWLSKQARNYSRYEQVQLSSGAKTEPTKARRTDEHARRQTGETGSKVVAWARSDSAPKKLAQSAAPVRAGLKCKSVDHLVWKCPRVAPEEAKRLYEEIKPLARGNHQEEDSAGQWMGFGLWRGATQRAVAKRNVTIAHVNLSVLAGFQEGLRVHIAREVKVDLDFSTLAGKLLLKNVECWVAAAPLAAGLGEILLSRREMTVMGYSAESIFDKARAENVEYDMVGEHPVKSPAVALLSRLEQPPARPMAEEEASFIPLEEAECCAFVMRKA
jgi:hypothetical protein